MKCKLISESKIRNPTCCAVISKELVLSRFVCTKSPVEYGMFIPSMGKLFVDLIANVDGKDGKVAGTQTSPVYYHR